MFPLREISDGCIPLCDSLKEMSNDTSLEVMLYKDKGRDALLVLFKSL